MAKGKKTGGRKKGTPNKVTTEVRKMILSALDEAGGKAYLVARAHDNPSAFLSLLGKVLPHEISGPEGEPLPIRVIREIRTTLGADEDKEH